MIIELLQAYDSQTHLSISLCDLGHVTGIPVSIPSQRHPDIGCRP
jgi:hypothetical protein